MSVPSLFPEAFVMAKGMLNIAFIPPVSIIHDEDVKVKRVVRCLSDPAFRRGLCLPWPG